MNAAVLAGGKGSRMNYADKAKLLYKEQTFLEIIISRMIDFDQIMVISNREKSEYTEIQARFYKDLIKDIGPIGGIYTALKHSNSHHVFFTSCDMPLVERENIRMICSQNSYDIVVPQYKGRYEMLFALYSKNCLSRIEEMIQGKSYRITGLFEDKTLAVKKIPIDEVFKATLRNINTEEDYLRLMDPRK